MNKSLEMGETQTEFRMRIVWDAPIEMDDGTVLRADVFLPGESGNYPVLMTYGPYAKRRAFRHGYKSHWDRMVATYPEFLQGSTGKFEDWGLVITPATEVARCTDVSLTSGKGVLNGCN